MTNDNDNGQRATDFMARLHASRQERDAASTRREQELNEDIRRRREFFEPVYALMDQMREARIIFPAGAPISGDYARDLNANRDGFPKVTIEIDASRAIEIGLALRDGELAYKAVLLVTGWGGKAHGDSLSTHDADELYEWMASMVTQFERTTRTSPTTTPARRSEADRLADLAHAEHYGYEVDEDGYPVDDDDDPPVTDDVGRSRRIDFED